jgi:hypothetical protein
VVSARLRQAGGLEGIGHRPAEIRPSDPSLADEEDKGHGRLRGNAGVLSNRHVAKSNQHPVFHIPNLVNLDPRLRPGIPETLGLTLPGFDAPLDVSLSPRSISRSEGGAEGAVNPQRLETRGWTGLQSPAHPDPFNLCFPNIRGENGGTVGRREGRGSKTPRLRNRRMPACGKSDAGREVFP